MISTSNNNDSSGTNIWFHGQTPTSTQFHIGTDGRIGDNVSTGAFVAYLWSEVKGYSKFTSFTGNGNADGPFIYLGFKPALIILKKLADEGWQMVDNKRDPNNVVVTSISPQGSAAERTDLTDIDFLANGFKLRGTDGSQNTSGSTYIYMAWAESPFTRTNAI